jgi:hypothetical protein
MTRNPKIASTVVLLIPIFVAFLWTLAFQDNDDPKNIKYVLWKHHLNPWMNLDDAAYTVVHDSERDQLIVGRSANELRKRFGYMIVPATRSPYFQDCAADSPTHGPPHRHDGALYLRQTDLIVFLNEGTATETMMCKG